DGADVVFGGPGGSPKQGLAGHATLVQALDAVRSGGKVVGVSWFGGPIELDVDRLRERSLRYLFPDVSTQAHLEHTVRLVASGRVQVAPAITHVLSGLERVPEAFAITANKGQYGAINPAQVVLRPPAARGLDAGRRGRQGEVVHRVVPDGRAAAALHLGPQAGRPGRGSRRVRPHRDERPRRAGVFAAATPGPAGRQAVPAAGDLHRRQRPL